MDPKTKKISIPLTHFKLYQKIYLYLHERLSIPHSELYIDNLYKKVLDNYKIHYHPSTKDEPTLNFKNKKSNDQKPLAVPPSSNRFKEVVNHLRQETKTCTACELHKGKRGDVSFGNKKSKVMIITDIPDYYDQLSGRYFSDKTGEIVGKIMKALGLKMEDIYISSAVKCFSAKAIPNQLANILKCSRFIEQEIENLSPKFILGFGENTYRMMHEGNRNDRWRGEIRKHRGINILFTHHPREMIFNQNFKKEAWDDLQKCLPLIKAIQLSDQTASSLPLGSAK